MPARRKRPTLRNFLFSALNKEFLIFLSFLLLSGAFWLIMALNETYERELLVPVRLENVPQKVVITSNTDDTLHVTVRERGYFLLAYQYGGLLQPVGLNFNTYNKGNGKGSATASDMQKQLYKQLYKSSRITAVKPDRFDFTYNYGDSKRVNVKLAGKITPGQSYYLARIKFTPDVVTVYADRQKLDSIHEIYTQQVNISNLTDTVVRQVNLARMMGVKCVPSSVSMALYPDILTEESVEVPIQAVNMPQGKVLRTFPARVKVQFTTGVSQFRNVQPEQFTVVADYRDIMVNPSDKCTLRLKVVPGGVRNARLSPSQVDYLIEEN